MAQALWYRINDALYQHVGKAAGFRVSEVRGKRSQGQLSSQSAWDLKRKGPEVMDCTHLSSNASVIKVCLQREISRPNSLAIPGGESKKYLAMT